MAAQLIPNSFPIPGETSLTNYSFFDIAGQTGIATFYGAIDQDGNGVLTTQEICSDKIYTKVVLTAGETATKDYDKDFDVTINGNLNIRGTFYAQIPVYITSADDSAYFTVKLRKYNGTTETEIASDNSITFQHTGGVFAHEKVVFVKFEVPETIIQKGETFRITLELWATGTAPAGACVVGHDPKNRVPSYVGTDTTFETGDITQLVFGVPIRTVL